MKILQRNLKRRTFVVWGMWRHHNICWKGPPFAFRQDWTRRSIFWKVLCQLIFSSDIFGRPPVCSSNKVPLVSGFFDKAQMLDLLGGCRPPNFSRNVCWHDFIDSVFQKVRTIKIRSSTVYRYIFQLSCVNSDITLTLTNNNRIV